MKKILYVFTMTLIIMSILHVGIASAGIFRVTITGKTAAKQVATSPGVTEVTRVVEEPAVRAMGSDSPDIEQNPGIGPSKEYVAWITKECGNQQDYPAGQRFDIVFGDNEYNSAFVDRKTCLMWPLEFVQINSSGYHTYSEANQICNNLALGGHTDWRLPSIFDLMSLVDNSNVNPALPADFPDSQSLDCEYPQQLLDAGLKCNFWTSSTMSWDPEHFIIDLVWGMSTMAPDNTNNVMTTCVRGNWNTGTYIDKH